MVQSRSSILRAELDRRAEYEVVVQIVLTNLDQCIGRLGDAFIQINWWGEEPEVIEPESST